MHTIGKILIRGLDVLLPIGVTLYFIYWLALFGDKMLVEMFRPVVPEA